MFQKTDSAGHAEKEPKQQERTKGSVMLTKNILATDQIRIILWEE